MVKNKTGYEQANRSDLVDKYFDIVNKSNYLAKHISDIESMLYEIINYCTDSKRVTINKRLTVREESLFIYNSPKKKRLDNLLTDSKLVQNLSKRMYSGVRESFLKISNYYQDTFEIDYSNGLCYLSDKGLAGMFFIKRYSYDEKDIIIGIRTYRVNDRNIYNLFVYKCYEDESITKYLNLREKLIYSTDILKNDDGIDQKGIEGVNYATCLEKKEGLKQVFFDFYQDIKDDLEKLEKRYSKMHKIIQSEFKKELVSLNLTKGLDKS
jgi:hypothetical protein